MAIMDPIKFGDITLQIGDGAASESFDTLCGFTSVTKSISVNTQTEDLPDCADADAVGFEGAVKISVGVQYSFQGFVDVESSDMLEDLAFDDLPRNVRLVYNKGTKVGYYEGPAILTAAEESFERRQSGKMSGTLKFTERPAWTAT